MKNIVENSANYWHFVVAGLISLEVLNQKIFISMMEPVHSVILSCVIISTLFIYLGGLITYLISIYLEDKSNANQEFLKRMDCLESNMQEVQGSLNEKITELRNLMHNDLDVKHQDLVERMVNQNILVESNQTDVMHSFNKQSELANKNREEVINSLLAIKILSKENTAELVSNIKGFEDKQQGTLEAINKQIEDVAFETRNEVSNMLSSYDDKTQQRFGSVAVALEDATSNIVDRVIEEASKTGEVIMGVRKSILIELEAESNLAQTNQEAIMESFGRQAEVAGKNKEELVAGLLLLEKLAKENKAELANSIVGFENKQQEAIEAVGKQIAETAVETKASVIETVSVCEEQLKQKLEEANAVIIGKVSEESNKVGDAVEETKKVIVARIEAESNLAQTNQEAIMESFGRLVKKENVTFDNMDKRIDVLEALINNSRIDLHNQFELLKKEQNDTFVVVLEQIKQINIATRDTIANEIAKLSIIEEILADEFEEEEEQEPKYDVSKPLIEIGDKYTAKKKNPDRTETIVDEKLGSKLNNTYKNDKLVLSQILTKGKVTYEVKYDEKERPKWSCTYDENNKPSIELEYYENGQVKKRVQNVMQNGIKMKQITNFDINGNKI
ncbi:MAG: hypothetical protein IJC05_01450 [Phascolarctobacterium sp.]|nr:hypothetical protein [Phascolarctobacterium sp.]